MVVGGIAIVDSVHPLSRGGGIISESVFSALPPAKRVKAYRDLAEQARRAAVAGKGDIRDAYIAIAEQSNQLASAAAAKVDD